MAIRSRNIYKPDGEKPFKLSRSKVDNYINCKRCFYIDRRLGVGQPPGFPFNINSAVDNPNQPVLKAFPLDLVKYLEIVVVAVWDINPCPDSLIKKIPKTEIVI